MSITFPKGFQAAGVNAGQKPGTADLALILNQGPSFEAGAVFTTNRVKAAPVKYSAQVMKHCSDAKNFVKAVLLNSAIANACTGPGGDEDAQLSAATVEKLLLLPAKSVLVCSTGIIGKRLKMPQLLAGIEMAVQHLDSDDKSSIAAARAIMTTDTVEKTAKLSRFGVRVGGIAKGAGMLAPQLATMLAVITTDAILKPDTAQRIIEEACEISFNRIDSDACMSTNDTVILLSSGASGIELPEEEIQQLINEVSQNLARQLIADAEGAAHDIKIRVTKASSESAALAVARQISRSNLVKTAIYGNDPNWGRIAAAVGTVDEEIAPFNPDELNIALQGVWVAKGGQGVAEAEVDLTAREVEILVELGSGIASGEIWTNDLTKEYVEENSAYSS